MVVFNCVFNFTPIPGEMIQFDLRNFFSKWVGSTTNTTNWFSKVHVTGLILIKRSMSNENIWLFRVYKRLYYPVKWIMINPYKDPHKTTSIMESKRFFSGSHEFAPQVCRLLQLAIKVFRLRFRYAVWIATSCTLRKTNGCFSESTCEWKRMFNIYKAAAIFCWGSSR